MFSFLILLREIILSKLLGNYSKPPLNAGVPKFSASSDKEFLQDLYSALTHIKSIAFTQGGAIVNYQDLRDNNEFLMYKTGLARNLATFSLSSLTNNQEKLAFWINIYNALTIDAIITFEIKKSLTETNFGLLSFFRKAAYEIDGNRYSLEDIEHGILRANSGHPYFPGPHFSNNDDRISHVIYPFDYRIHFALNCASISCPPIAFYQALNLESQLDLAMHNFIDQETILELKEKKIVLSTIFKWYESDFDGKEGIRNLLLAVLPKEGARQIFLLKQNKARFSFRKYHWDLNS